MSRICELKTFTKCDVAYWNSITKDKKDSNLICGVKDSKEGAIYIGQIDGCGKLYKVVVPNCLVDENYHEYSTQVTFGRYLGNDHYNLVGKVVYKDTIDGFSFFGKLHDLDNAENYKVFGAGDKVTVPTGF